jgi:hypothetical protein
MANNKYKSLIELQRIQGVLPLIYLNHGRNAMYDSATIHNDLLEAIDTVLVKKLKTELRKSPWVSIGVDESTDRSKEKHVVTVIRYVGSNGLQATVLKLSALEKCDAQSIYSTVMQDLRDFGATVDRVMGLVADGASVMASDLNGFTGPIHQDNPFAICMHCVCHKLNLAVSQASKAVSGMQVITSLLSSCYSFANGSSNRIAAFQGMAEVLGESATRILQVLKFRWLSSGQAVNSVLRNYNTLVSTATNEAAEKEDPVALGLEKQLRRYKVVALLHFVANLLSVMDHLHKVFQRRDAYFGLVHTGFFFI